MIRRSLAIVPTLAVGTVIAGALYWLFLNTPESNVLMLTASAVLLLMWLVVTGITINAAVLMAYGAPLRRALGPATHGLGWFVVAALPLAGAWWLLGRADTWVTEHTGEINAWFIARAGWADITPLLTAQMWITRWLRWAGLPMMAVSLLAALLVRGPERPRPLRRVWHWRALLAGTLAFAFLFWLPWQLAAWRPPVPATWVDPAVAAFRLGTVFLLVIAGAAVMIVAAVGAPRRGR